MNANIKSPLNDVKAYMSNVGQAARDASRAIGRASTAQKNQALIAIADRIGEQAELLKKANALDLAAGKEKVSTQHCSIDLN